LEVIDLMVASDGVEPPTPAFSGLRSALGDVQKLGHRFCTSLHEKRLQITIIALIGRQRLHRQVLTQKTLYRTP